MYYLPCNDELIFLDNGWVFSLWDTVSNVVYFSMGVLGMFLTHRDTVRRFNITTAAEFKATEHPLISSWNCMLLYGWIIVIGMASTVYHSTLQPWSLCMDFFAIKIFALLIIWSLGHALSFFHDTAYLVLGTVALGTTGTLMAVSSLDPDLQDYSIGAYNTIVSLMMAAVYGLIVYHLTRRSALKSWEEAAVAKYRERYHAQARYNLGISTALFAISLVFYFLPKLACGEYRHSELSGLLHMHAYWHIFSGVSLFFCVRSLTFLYK